MTAEPMQVDRDRAMRPAFAPYLRLMPFLAELLGPQAEILLHDTSDLSSSVVALVNGHISGRDIGAPATDLVLKILRNHERHDGDFLANYPAESNSGRRFRSSTLFIRDDEGKLAGMLCVNIDDTDLLGAAEVLRALTATAPLAKGDAGGGAVRGGEDEPVPRARPSAERLNVSVEEMTVEVIGDVVASPAVSSQRMTSDEKLEVVRRLDEVGVFLVKGSVAAAAAALAVSEPTVYRYLRQVRRSMRP